MTILYNHDQSADQSLNAAKFLRETVSRGWRKAISDRDCEDLVLVTLGLIDSVTSDNTLCMTEQVLCTIGAGLVTLQCSTATDVLADICGHAARCTSYQSWHYPAAVRQAKAGW